MNSAGAQPCPQDQSQRVEANDVWKNLRLLLAEVLRLDCDTATLRAKAAVNAPQSRRCAMFEEAGLVRACLGVRANTRMV